MATTREHEHEIARLQTRLADRLARLDALDQAGQDYDSSAADVIAAAHELIDYEDRVPQLLDEQPRRITMFVLRGSGAATMAIAAGLALGVVPGGRSWWWLPIAMAFAVAGARLLTTRVRHGRSDHVGQRPSAALIVSGAVLAGLAEIGLFTLWLLGASVVLVLAGLFAGSRPVVEMHDLASGEPLDLDLRGHSGPSDPATLLDEER